MGSNTKIVVLHSKTLLYGAILAFAMICIIILFFSTRKSDSSSAIKNELSRGDDVSQENHYEAGVYSSTFSLGDHRMEVSVYLDTDHINGISLSYLDEYMETMYPLMQPTFQDLAAQIVEHQNLSEITYPAEQKYTSITLLKGIYQTLQLGIKK